MVGKFMSTTKILGEAVGIQRQDIIDQTEEQLTDSLSSATILGRFRRGRLDKPMTIHQGNIRGQLGYDPKNPDYIAVQDCLDTDVPSVQVLRIANSNNKPDGGVLPPFPVIPDENISDYIEYSGWFGLYWMSDIEWQLEVNGVLYKQTTPTGIEQGQGYYNTMDGSLKQIIGDHHLPFNAYEDSSGNGTIRLNGVGEYKLRFIPQSLTTEFPNKYPAPRNGAIPIIDPATKIWSLILRKTEE
jgi:hypothetical protein